MSTVTGIDELARTVALMRLMHETGGTAHLTGAALASVLAEYDRRESMEQRARSLAATQGLDGAARTYAHAGRYVLGLATHTQPVEVTA